VKKQKDGTESVGKRSLISTACPTRSTRKASLHTASEWEGSETSRMTGAIEGHHGSEAESAMAASEQQRLRRERAAKFSTLDADGDCDELLTEQAARAPSIDKLPEKEVQGCPLASEAAAEAIFTVAASDDNYACLLDEEEEEDLAVARKGFMELGLATGMMMSLSCSSLDDIAPPGDLCPEGSSYEKGLPWLDDLEEAKEDVLFLEIVGGPTVRSREPSEDALPSNGPTAIAVVGGVANGDAARMGTESVPRAIETRSVALSKPGSPLNGPLGSPSTASAQVAPTPIAATTGVATTASVAVSARLRYRQALQGKCCCLLDSETGPGTRLPSAGPPGASLLRSLRG